MKTPSQLAYEAALAEGKSETEALLAGVDAADAALAARNEARQAPPAPAPATPGGDALLAAAAEADAQAEATRQHAKGARHLLSQQGVDDLSEWSDEEVLDAWTKIERQRAEDALANDLAANVEAAARDTAANPWSGSPAEREAEAQRRGIGARGTVGTPWNVEGAQ